MQASETRFELIGVNAVHKSGSAPASGEPAEVRIRVAGRTESLGAAIRTGNEVETLYTNGPAGGRSVETGASGGGGGFDTDPARKRAALRQL